MQGESREALQRIYDLCRATHPSAAIIACGQIAGEALRDTPPAAPQEREAARLDAALTMLEAIQRQGYFIHRADGQLVEDRHEFVGLVVNALGDVEAPPPTAGASEPSDDKGAQFDALLSDLRELEGHYSTDRVAHIQARQIERIFDRWLHESASPHAEPARCVWRQTNDGAWTNPCASVSTPQGFHRAVSDMWAHCPYCGKPLTLSPTTTELLSPPE